MITSSSSSSSSSRQVQKQQQASKQQQQQQLQQLEQHKQKQKSTISLTSQQQPNSFIGGIGDSKKKNKMMMMMKNETNIFKPYTQSLIVSPSLNKTVAANKNDTTRSRFNDPVELLVDVNTPKWRRDPHVTKKCLRMIWRLVHRFNQDEPGWHEIEFDYEAVGLSFRVSASSDSIKSINSGGSNSSSSRNKPVRVRVSNMRKNSSNSGQQGVNKSGSNNSGNGMPRVIVRHCDNIPLRISLKENRAPISSFKVAADGISFFRSESKLDQASRIMKENILNKKVNK